LAAHLLAEQLENRSLSSEPCCSGYSFAVLAVIFRKSTQELTGYLFTQFILRNTAILNKVMA